MDNQLPPMWQQALAAELERPSFKELQTFLESERQVATVYPPEGEVFTAFHLTPYDQVRVLLLGQDPYHDDNQAHGLAFSVRPGIKPPPSLRNIYTELKNDLGLPAPSHGSLIHWAKQGVLLMNAVLTVRAHSPNSHKNRGWELFTDGVIRALNAREKPLVFVLWGGYAQKKAPLIDAKRHVVITSAHPSPLSARNGFFGSRPFSRINEALESLGHEPISWALPQVASIDG